MSITEAGSAYFSRCQQILIAKRLTSIRISICASPDYLEQNGIPRTPLELQDHAYLKYSYSDNAMLFAQFDKHAKDIKPSNSIICNNGDLLVSAAINGEGFVIQPTFIAGEAISAGKLQSILIEYEPEPIGLYAVYAHRKFLASKVRSFVDFISDYYGDVPYWDQS